MCVNRQVSVNVEQTHHKEKEKNVNTISLVY